MISGLLLLRLVMGLTIAAHGAQKLFGWWGGGGPDGTAKFMDSLEMRTPKMMAMMAAASELLGGLAIALGFATPLAALAVATVMGTAILSVHIKNGFFNSDGGYEYNIMIAAIAVALADLGPSKWSVDYAFGWTDYSWWSGWQTALVVAIAAIVISALNVTAGRKKSATI